MSKEYNGPDVNEFYEDTAGDIETFDDLGDGADDEEMEIQGTTAHDPNSDEDDEEEEIILPSDAKKKAKEAAKKAKGQKGDDMEVLEDSDGFDEDEDGEEPEEVEETEESKPENKEVAEEKPVEVKGKKIYMKLGDETFVAPADAIIRHRVDGKMVDVPLQEALNDYSGRVATAKRFNEINVKEQSVKKESQRAQSIIGKFDKLVERAKAIVQDPSKDPDEILDLVLEEIDLDSLGIDSYDLKERATTSKAARLIKLANMDPIERKAFLAEERPHPVAGEKHRHLQRRTAFMEEQKHNSWLKQNAALRNSLGVSEEQYFDAHRELTQQHGIKDEELADQTVVEWAALKPHRSKVVSILTPFRDQFADDEAFGESVYKLSHLLRQGAETEEGLKKAVREVYGIPSEAKELSKKLSRVGRKPVHNSQKSKSAPQAKGSYDSFDDIDED